MSKRASQPQPRPIHRPDPQYSSRCVIDQLETGQRRVELFLQIGDVRLIARELSRMSKATAYLKSNFPPPALARGPIPR